MSTNQCLGTEPYVDPTAVISDSRLGIFTEVGPRTLIRETDLGDYSYVTGDCDVIYTDIGKFCSIASHVRINPGNHPMWRATQHHFTYRSAQYGLAPEDDASFFDWRREHKVRIGHDVWIGHGAIVLPGVEIGSGAVIGAGSVVTKDVPAYTVAVGVPAKPVKRRLSEQAEEALLRIRWWDWPHGRLASALQDFRSLSAEAFARKYDPQ